MRDHPFGPVTAPPHVWILKLGRPSNTLGFKRSTPIVVSIFITGLTSLLKTVSHTESSMWPQPMDPCGGPRAALFCGSGHGGGDPATHRELFQSRKSGI